MNSAPLGTPRAGGGGASPRQLKPSSASLKALVSNGEKMARRHNAWLYMSQLDQDQHGGLDTTLVPLGVGERHDDYRRLQEETRLRHEQQELANLRAEQVEDRTARLACEVAAHEAERKRSAELAQQLIASRAAQEALVAEGRQVSEEMGRLRRCLEEEKAALAAEMMQLEVYLADSESKLAETEAKALALENELVRVRTTIRHLGGVTASASADMQDLRRMVATMRHVSSAVGAKTKEKQVVIDRLVNTLGASAICAQVGQKMVWKVWRRLVWHHHLAERLRVRLCRRGIAIAWGKWKWQMSHGRTQNAHQNARHLEEQLRTQFVARAEQLRLEAGHVLQATHDLHEAELEELSDSLMLKSSLMDKARGFQEGTPLSVRPSMATEDGHWSDSQEDDFLDVSAIEPQGTRPSSHVALAQTAATMAAESIGRLEEDNAQLSRLVGQLGQEEMELRSLKTQEKKLVLQAQQRLAETGELRKKNVELIARESTSAETVCIIKALMH